MITARIDRVTDIPAEYRAEAPPAPVSVKIELTGRCNYRCGFCALRLRDVPARDMDLTLFRRITVEMLDAGVREIGLFFLGESFLAPGLLIEAVKWCKQIGIPYVFLTTNGSAAIPEILREVMHAGLDSLKWSINAADGEQFVQIMGVKDDLLERSLENLRAARAIRDAGRFPCRLYASSILYSEDQRARMEPLLAGRVLPYVDEHYWLPLYSMAALATARERELGYRPIAGNQGRLDNLRQPLPCWSVFREGHVTAEGKLSACCFDADGRFAMADLTKTPFLRAWHSLDFQRLREAHLKQDVSGTVCEGCIAYA